MEPINLVFFALATLFGNSDSRVVCNTVFVNVTPANKTIEIVQEDIFSVYISADDSITTMSELKVLAREQKRPSGIAEGFSVQQFNFSTTADGKLNATITLTYDDPSRLKGFGIDHSDEGYHLISVPEWQIKSGTPPQGNYLFFPPSKSFRFSMQPFLNMPAEYKAKKTGLAKYWASISAHPSF